MDTWETPVSRSCSKRNALVSNVGQICKLPIFQAVFAATHLGTQSIEYNPGDVPGTSRIQMFMLCFL